MTENVYFLTKPLLDNMANQYLTEDELEKMMDDDFIERAKGLGPISWEWYARSLKHAADILHDRYKLACNEANLNLGGRMNVPEEEPYERDLRLSFVYYLLMGLAIENLVKGIIMVKHPEYLKDSTQIKCIGTHNTFKLLNENKIDGFIIDKDILIALSKSVKWMSKYPVSLRRVDFDWGCDWVNPEDIDKLYKKLYKKLNEEKLSQGER